MLFLVHHGDVVWKLGLAVLTVGCTALIASRAGWLRMLVTGVAFAAGWYAALVAVGRVVLPADTGPYDRFAARLVAATALPGVRDTAIERILHAPTTNDEAGLALAIDRLRVREICPDRRLAELGRLDEARDAARACGRDDRGYDFQRGDFATAESPLLRAIAANDWATAATLVPRGGLRTLLSAWASGRPASYTIDSGDQLDSPGIWTDEVLSEFDQLARDSLRGIAVPTERAPLEIAIRAGAPLDDVDLDDAPPGVASLARGELPQAIDLASDCPLQDALRAARAGDGGPLALLSRSCPLSWNDAPLIEVVLPRVREHRGDLALALRMLRDPHGYEETSPFVLIDLYAQYRDLARLAGDKDETARWQQLVDRFADLLSDRRRAQAFALAARL